MLETYAVWIGYFVICSVLILFGVCLWSIITYQCFRATQNTWKVIRHHWYFSCWTNFIQAMLKFEEGNRRVLSKADFHARLYEFVKFLEDGECREKKMKEI